MKTKISFLPILMLLLPLLLQAQCLNQIDAGYFYAFGIKENGTLWGWGNNSQSGQLGNGTEVDLWTPTQISNASNWQNVVCGSNTMVAIKSDGTLWVCGDNTAGELGLGISNLYLSTLTQQGTATNWKQAVVGDFSSYGIKTNGTLWGWGQNDGGQMGNNTCCSDQTTPVQIGTDTDWKQVAASGSRSAFAIKTNGTLWGWGSNIAYLLGNSSVSVLAVPTQFTTDTDWDSIDIGKSHVLALKTDHSLWAWGEGGSGETGQDPSGGITNSVPFQIPGLWSKVAAGYRFSMGIKTDGTLWTWGKNNVGQLGDGTTTNRYIPYQISTATNWVSVSCGYQFTIALRADGSLWSWGNNYYGELGNGTDSTTQATPTAISVTGCNLATPQFERQVSLVVSPNPAVNQLTVSYKGLENVEAIVIYDLSGKTVYTLPAMGNNAFSSSFNTNALTPGSYILSLQANGKTVVSKQFVKN
ncbi:T9SS type A sorting domain-containing protein [Flavobacterium sp. XGLA_31]|uniref:T9SS type A sorting domain-containing protein n=1 Tax=Flavobacterium sp. XGLA_31 TaxID=3447666 RepID=UPI003F3A18CA